MSGFCFLYRGSCSIHFSVDFMNLRSWDCSRAFFALQSLQLSIFMILFLSSLVESIRCNFLDFTNLTFDASLAVRLPSSLHPPVGICAFQVPLKSSVHCRRIQSTQSADRPGVSYANTGLLPSSISLLTADIISSVPTNACKFPGPEASPSVLALVLAL